MTPSANQTALWLTEVASRLRPPHTRERFYCGVSELMAPMTEADARVLLRDCDGVGGLEAWIAGRRWKPAPGGWAVSGELQGWQFQVVKVLIYAPGLQPEPGGQKMLRRSIERLRIRDRQ